MDRDYEAELKRRKESCKQFVVDIDKETAKQFLDKLKVKEHITLTGLEIIFKNI